MTKPRVVQTGLLFPCLERPYLNKYFLVISAIKVINDNISQYWKKPITSRAL
jgi:hypothetical protein